MSIPLYDLPTGQSIPGVPPYDLPTHQYHDGLAELMAEVYYLQCKLAKLKKIEEDKSKLKEVDRSVDRYDGLEI
jgi:hypothetical protein